MKDQTIQFECGCQYKKSELKYRNGRKKNGKYTKSGFFCPSHNKIAEFKISKCIDCGVAIINNRLSGNNRLYCDDCKQKRIDARTKTMNTNAVKDRQKIRFKKMGFNTPVKVWSIAGAFIKNVPCIPLEKLFPRRVMV